MGGLKLGRHWIKFLAVLCCPQVVKLRPDKAFPLKLKTKNVGGIYREGALFLFFFFSKINSQINVRLRHCKLLTCWIYVILVGPTEGTVFIVKEDFFKKDIYDYKFPIKYLGTGVKKSHMYTYIYMLTHIHMYTYSMSCLLCGFWAHGQSGAQKG